jgi:hypothetical protein
MTITNIWLGNTISNYKVVTLVPGGDIEAANPTFSVGLGNKVFTFQGWNPTNIVTAWNASTDPIIAEVYATVSGNTVVLTAVNAGEDFEVTVTQNVLASHSTSTYQLLNFEPLPTGGTFTLTVQGLTTGAITYSAVAATMATNIQTAIAALYSAGDVTVTAQTTIGSYLLDFSTGRFVGVNIPAVTATYTNLTGGTASTSVSRLSAATTGVNQVVSLTFPINGTHTENVNTVQTLSTTAVVGTFTMSIAGYGTTIALSYVAGRSAIREALETIVGVGNVQVTGGPLYFPYDITYRTITIEFIGSLAGVTVPTMTVTAAGNTVNAVQSIRMTNSPTSGTFSLSFGGNTTGALAYNATAPQIQTALTGLASIGAGNLIASGGPLMPTGTPVATTVFASDAANVNQSGAYVDRPPSNLGSYFRTIAPSVGYLGEMFVRFPITGTPTVASLQLVNLYNNISNGTVAISVANAVSPSIPATPAQYSAMTFSGSVTSVTVAALSPLGYTNTFDVLALIQTVLNRADWVDGGSVLLRITPQASDPGQAWYSTRADASATPRLFLTAIVGAPAGVQVTFQGSLSGTNVALLTAATISGTGTIAVTSLVTGGVGSYTVVNTQAGGSTSVQNISGGTFSLKINNRICGPIAYNASASTIAAAVNTAFGSTVCTGTGGPAPGTAVILTFSGALGLQPVTLTYLNALQTNQAGSVKKSVIVLGVAPAVATNVWDLVICPGAGTLGISTDPTYARVELNITNTLPSLKGPASQRPIGTIYLPLYNLNARLVEAAINEAMGCDACRVCRVGRSQEWSNVVVPADPTGAYSSGFPAANTSFWYMKDTYRIVFVNQFAAAGATNVTATFPLVSGVPALPSVFMLSSTTILNPNNTDALDIFPEINRVVIGFQLMQSTLTPLHQATIQRSASTPANNVSWRFKMQTQYAGASTAHTGIDSYVSGGKISFAWITETVSDTGVSATTSTLASTPVMDWNTSADAIQVELQRIFGPNILVTGSLNGSWLSESLKDAPTLGYQELVIKFSGSLYGMPIDEFGYNLVCYVSSLQFATPTSFQKNFQIIGERVTKTLPPRTNQRERITVSSPAKLDGIAFGVNNYLFSVAPASTASTIQASFDQALGANLSSLLPEKLAHPVIVYGTNLAEGPLEFEFSSYGLQQSSTVTLWVSTEPAGQKYGQIAVSTIGVTATDENQYVSILGKPYSGTFTLSWNGNTTVAMAYNISLTSFISALSAATPSAISPTAVTGDAIQGFNLNWAAAGGARALAVTSSALNNGKVASLVVNIGGRTGTVSVVETIKGVGPNYYDVPTNWSLKHVPTSDETIVVDDSSSAIMYGVDQSCAFNVDAITTSPTVFSSKRCRQVYQQGQQVQFICVGTAPTGLVAGTRYIVNNPAADGTFRLQTIAGSNIVVTTAGSGTFTLVVAGLVVQGFSRFTGNQIGLPHTRTVAGSLTPEYLPCYLKAYFASIDIGINDGDGLGLGRFDTMDNPTTIYIEKTGTSGQANIPAVLILANNSATTLLQDSGSVGLSIYAEESSTIGTITVKQGTFVAGNATISKLAQASGATVKVYGATAISNQVGLS